MSTAAVLLSDSWCSIHTFFPFIISETYIHILLSVVIFGEITYFNVNVSALVMVQVSAGIFP